MSVVFAQLYVSGKCHGVHAFLVKIRDQETHETVPGVTIGDCGPKNGMNGVDNGFILFDQYKVPFESQLSRLSGVDENGKYFTTIEN